MACTCENCICEYKCTVDQCLGVIYDNCILSLSSELLKEDICGCSTKVSSKEECKHWQKVDCHS